MQGTKVKVIALCLLLSVQLSAVDVVEEKAAPLFENEISSLQQLISVNEKRLVAQKELKAKMELFKKQKEQFLLGNQSKGHTFSMVSTAREILVSVKEEHLSYLFATDYLEELLFFSSVAAKSVPIKP